MIESEIARYTANMREQVVQEIVMTDSDNYVESKALADSVAWVFRDFSEETRDELLEEFKKLEQWTDYNFHNVISKVFHD